MFSKCNFYVIKLKKNLFPFLFTTFAISLLVFSKNNLPAVKSGLLLWASSVVPSLFPFFVATELLMHTNIINFLGIILNKWMKPLFNIRGEGSFALVMGLISGYPIGAKIACNFRENNICSKVECERLISFTNNSGPLFIIGTVGISMFGNSTIGALLFITHILACFTVGFIFRYWKFKDEENKYDLKNKNTSKSFTTVSVHNLGEVLAESITSATSTILLIGGFVVLFSSIISILKASGILNSISLLFVPLFNSLNLDTSFIPAILTGILEITNGIELISNISIKNISINVIISAFILGCGGLSIFLQVLSITSKTDLSIKPYLYGKILHGLFAALYTFIAISVIPFFNFNL